MILFRKTRQAFTAADIDTYIDLCGRCADVLKKLGINTKAFKGDPSARIKAHKNPHRVVESLRNYVLVLEEGQRAGDDLWDCKKLVWRMVSKMGYTPSSDIFGLIEQGDVIEIYTSDNWQIFRNLPFFQYVSMSIDELATFDWAKDSVRTMKITIPALEMAARLRLGILRKTVDVRHWQQHTVRELLGEGWTILVQLKFVSPLKGPSGETVALVINNSKVTDFGTSGLNPGPA